jgi:hypothetical protein
VIKKKISDNIKSEEYNGELEDSDFIDYQPKNTEISPKKFMNGLMNFNKKV